MDLDDRVKSNLNRIAGQLKSQNEKHFEELTTKIYDNLGIVETKFKQNNENIKKYVGEIQKDTVVICLQEV